MIFLINQSSIIIEILHAAKLIVANRLSIPVDCVDVSLDSQKNVSGAVSRLFPLIKLNVPEFIPISLSPDEVKKCVEHTISAASREIEARLKVLQ